jgi:hypothetical protein
VAIANANAATIAALEPLNAAVMTFTSGLTLDQLDPFGLFLPAMQRSTPVAASLQSLDVSMRRDGSACCNIFDELNMGSGCNADTSGCDSHLLDEFSLKSYLFFCEPTLLN